MSALQEAITALKQDHDNGASVLANQALESLHKIVSLVNTQIGREVKDGASFWHLLASSAWELKLARPSMDAAIGGALIDGLANVRTNWIERFRGNWEETEDVVELRKLAKRGLSKTTVTRKRENFELGNYFVDWLREKEAALGGKRPLRILTLSHSSSVNNCLTRAITGWDPTRLQLDVRILESRPRFEGASLALFLARLLPSSSATESVAPPNQSMIQIASDASVAMLAKDVDILLLGADRISRSGDVSNKIGSLPAVLCAKALSKGVVIVVIAESDKIVADEDLSMREPEENAGGEISEAWGKSWKDENGARSGTERIKIRNVYFETVGKELIDFYFCERGRLRREDVHEISVKKEGQEHEIFGPFMS
jgi:translation initiation factor 2B subunit (eIF-2B alpha/beta/delta family)